MPLPPASLPPSLRPPLLRALRAALLLVLLAAAAHPSAGLEAAIAEVESIRGLSFRSPVEVEVLPRTDLRKVLEAQIEKDAPLPLDQYMRILEQMLLIETSDGAVDSLMDVYEAQVLAFYDPSTRTYYTFDRAPDGNALDAMMADAIAVHELTHALQDQRFGAGDRIRRLQSDWDAQLAYHAVLEGEATFVMLASMLGRLGVALEDLAGNEELLGSMASVAAVNPGFPADAPRYFVESMKFPYLNGLALVMEAYRREGWRGVDALHERPPASTLDVLEPARYFARIRRPRSIPCAGEGAAIATSFGAFHWTFLLGEAPATGWEGDCIRAVPAGGSLRIEGTSRWTDPGEAKEFAAALRSLLEARARGGEVRVDGREVAFAWGER